MFTTLGAVKRILTGGGWGAADGGEVKCTPAACEGAVCTPVWAPLGLEFPPLETVGMVPGALGNLNGSPPGEIFS